MSLEDSGTFLVWNTEPQLRPSLPRGKTEAEMPGLPVHDGAAIQTSFACFQCTGFPYHNSVLLMPSVAHPEHGRNIPVASSPALCLISDFWLLAWLK